jgi:hypothetical protein
MKMRDDELVALCQTEIDACLGGDSGQIASERAEAMGRYLGDAYGNETEGRSQVRTREVADTIEWILPSLMRIFFDADNAVEFVPRGPEDEAQAQQETDRVRYEVYERNPGFMRLYTLFKDALLSKVGIAKVTWQDDERTEREAYRNLMEIELAALLQDPAVQREVLDFERNLDGSLNVVFAATTTCGKAAIECVPPEEFGIDARTHSYDPAEAQFAYHKTEMTRSQLLEAGYDRATVEALPSGEAAADEEELARYDKTDDDLEGDDRLEKIPVIECYVRVDRNDDGIDELLKVTLAGESGSFKLLDVEDADAIPFVALCPVPITHKFFGLSIADLVMDIQEIKTALLRGILDNLYLANNGRLAASNRANLEDLTDARPGGIVRIDTEAPDVSGHVQPLATPTPPTEAFGMLEYMDGVLRQRTGVGDEVMGLDAASLAQTQTTALAQAYDAARMRIELIARIFAETGVKSLFLRVHRLLSQNQKRAEVVKLRNQWVPVNPSEWRQRENLRVTIGVGNTSKVQRQAALQQVMALQNAYLQFGAMGQLITPQHLYRTAAELCEVLGLKDPSLYFADPAQMPPPPPPPPDPKMIEMQMKSQIEQAKLQLDQQRLQLDAAKLQQDGQIKQVDVAMRAKESDLKSQIDQLKANAALQKQVVDERSQVMNAQASAAKTYSDAAATRIQQRIDLLEAEKDRALEAYKAQLDAAVKLQLQGLQAQQAQMQAEQQQGQQQDGEMTASLYDKIEALTQTITQLEQERSQPLEIERGEDGRIARVGGRMVERDAEGRPVRIH